MTDRLGDTNHGWKMRLAVCVAVFVVLVIWLIFWPYTGDGDAALHYRNLREGAFRPSVVLSAWARPLYAAVMLAPALGGVFVIRTFTAMLSTVLVWQTMRAADDLGLRNSLIAGLMVVWQPFAFALASDTMTEMPMALGIIVAIRLWWARRHALSAVLVSLLPMVRPEGFFLIVAWAVMLLVWGSSRSHWSRRLGMCALLGTGMLCWILACAVIVREPFYFIRAWSWPAGSYASYGSGPLLHYVRRLPEYCGPILFPLFIAGIIPSVNRKMALPWTIWTVVLVVHSILWWGGWFASVGLIRLLACTSPMTALVCLHGWNLIGRSRLWHAVPRQVRMGVAAVVFLLACATPMVRYVAVHENHHPKLICQAAAYIKTLGCLEGAPTFFVSDELALGALDYPAYAEKWVPIVWDRGEQLEMLASLPTGTIGIWDNNRGESWFNVRIAELTERGYDIVFETEQTLPAFSILGLWSRDWSAHQRCVVVRKIGVASQPSNRSHSSGQSGL